MDKERIQYAFLDSGIGGIPYLNYLKELCPAASCVYIADTVHFPYGEKTVDEVIEFSCRISEKIINSFSPDIIIIACNTISVSALDSLRKKFKLPFVGTVPAIKPAAALSKNKKIGVLATERTIKDIYIKKLIEEFGAGCTFFPRADSNLVSLIENKLLEADEDEKIKAVLPAMEFFRAAGADTVVLGCTHFLHLKKTFIKEGGTSIGITDSLEGVVNQAFKLSPFTSTGNIKTQNGKTELFITSQSDVQVKNAYSRYAALFDMELKFI